MAFSNFLDPIFGPLLLLQPWASLTILAFLISLIIVLVYKFVTDQDLMKTLKAEIKEFQKEMKELKDHPEQAMAVNKKAMETNMKYMSHSMKPTLFTFLPIILIFAWMNANLAYEPILPGQEFSVIVELDKAYTGEVSLGVPEGLELVSEEDQEVLDRKARWTLKGDEGNYLITLDVGGKEFQKDVKIATTHSYATIEEKYSGELKKIVIGNNPIKPLGEFSLFGWRPGWLGTYILLSIVFSMVLRKLFKVY